MKTFLIVVGGVVAGIAVVVVALFLIVGSALHSTTDNFKHATPGSQAQAHHAVQSQQAKGAPSQSSNPQNGQADQSAQEYLSMGTGFSRQGLIDQLTSASEGFSQSIATQAVDAQNADWNAQAVESAKSYVQNVGGFSHSALVQQLEYDKFTDAQSEYAADKVLGVSSGSTSSSTNQASSDQGGEDAASVVQQFYSDINSSDYTGAYALYSSSMQSQMGSESTWANGYADTSSVQVSQIQDQGNGSVSVVLYSTNDDGTSQDFSGTYTVSNGQITGASIS